MKQYSNLIATELYAGQGLGNQLWGYAATRSIAEHLGFGFVLHGLENFKGHEFLEIDPLVNATQEDQVRAQRGEIPRHYETQYYDGELKCFSSGFDETIIQLAGSCQLEGLFQSEKYFFGDLDKLKGYIRIRPEWHQRCSIPDDTCILNVRGGEYKRHSNLILPMNYWEHAIRHMQDQRGVRKFLIVTDDVKYAEAIFPKYEILRGGVGDCYVALNSARNLVVSNSSFSYFPIKTNPNQPYVIAPKHWARFGNPHDRWASPANLYESWLWQDKVGNLHSFEDCLPGCDATENYYRSHYPVRTTPEQLRGQTCIRQLLPTSIRKQAKKLLSIAFPKKFG